MLAAVIAIIAMGIGSFVGMLSTFNNLDRARGSYYSQCRMADFWIDLKKAPVEEAKRRARIPGISEIRTRISFQVVVDLEGVDQPISGMVISMPPEPEPVINNLVMEQGSYFTADRRNQVIVSEKFAKARNIQPGMFINLVLNGQKKQVYVIGTAISAEHIYFAPPGGIVDNPRQYGAFYLKRDYVEDMFGFHGACNEVVGLLTPEARKHPQPVLDKLDKQLNEYGVFSVTPLKQQFSNLNLTSEMGGLQTMATMFPILFLSVAALVMNVLMMRMAEQQRTIVGTLKALGYYNSSVFDHFIKFGLVVGVLGGIFGCLIGYWVAGGMTGMYRSVFEFPHLVNDVYPGIMLTAMIISITFAVLGTLRGVRQVVDLNPAEAMREPAPAVGGSILLEHWQWFWTRLDFRWQMIMRGLFRNKLRTLIAIFAATMGAGMVVMAFGFVNSMSKMINFQFEEVMHSDYTMTLKDELSGEAVLEARQLPGVIQAEPVFNVACTFYNKNHTKKGSITGLLPDADLTTPRQEDGTAVPVPPVGLLMPARLAGQLHLSAGDTVDLIPVKGEKRRYTVPVAGIIHSMIGLTVYADYHYLNRLVGEVNAISELQLKASQTPDEQRDFYHRCKQFPRLSALDVVAIQKKVIARQFNNMMLSMAIGMIMFAAVIFFGSILNGSLIAIAERRREIATFRVLGYQATEVSEIFLRENMITNMIGAVLGLPVGYILLYGMMSQFQNDAYSMPSYISSASMAWTLVLAVVFILCSQWIIHRSILKMQWQEALSMKE
jgi:putative ABC transport system permease protein